MSRDDIVHALAPYGAGLDGDTIVRNGRALGVTLTVRRGRLVAEGRGGRLYSGPAVPASVARFVESYWYWSPAK